MCSCPAHHDLVDCECQCDHTNDRLTQWQARALAAEDKLERMTAKASDHIGDLIRQRDEALAEVARLRAGETAEPTPEGTELTPGQWIRRWNEETADERLQRVTHIRTAFRAWRECEETDHRRRLEHAEEQMAALRDHRTRWETTEARLDQLRAYARWCNDRSVEPETRDLLAIADGREHHDYVIPMKRAAQ